MRLYQLLESDLGPNERQAQSYAMDFLTRYANQKKDGVPVDLLINYLKTSYDANPGVDIDENFIINILSNLDFIEKIEPDIKNNNKLTIFFKSQFQGKPEFNRSGDPEKEKKEISKKAANIAKKHIKKED